MANVIARVTSLGGRAPVSGLVTTPLGLDVWEVGPDHLVVQADEAQAARLEAMGYGVEQLQTTESHLSDFATARAMAGYHTVQTLEADLRHLADDNPEIVELHEIGRSVENRPLWALRIGERRGSARKVAVLGCHHAREWVSVEVPYLLAEHLVASSSTEPIMTSGIDVLVLWRNRQDGAVRDFEKPSCDAAHQHADEPTVSAGTDHDEIGTFLLGELDNRLSRTVRLDNREIHQDSVPLEVLGLSPQIGRYRARTLLGHPDGVRSGGASRSPHESEALAHVGDDQLRVVRLRNAHRHG